MHLWGLSLQRAYRLGSSAALDRRLLPCETFKHIAMLFRVSISLQERGLK